MLFKKDQKQEMEMVKEKYFSPDEMARMRKAKLRIKVHFQKFFRFLSDRRNMIMFNRWKDYTLYVIDKERRYLVDRKV